MWYGRALERAVARTIGMSDRLSSLFRYKGDSPGPDFVGMGDAAGLSFEVTTFKGIAEHLSRPYGGDIIVTPYEVSFPSNP